MLTEERKSEIRQHRKVLHDVHLERLAYKMKDPLSIMIFLDSYGLLYY